MGYRFNHLLTLLAALLMACESTQADVLYSITDLGSLVSNGSSQAFDVNNSGQVTGRSDKPNGGYAPFLYSGGTIAQCGPTTEQAIGYSINNNGQVAGWTDGGSLGYWAFTYSSGILTFLTQHSNVPYSEAHAINDSGQVTGHTEPSNQKKSFLYSNGIMSDLGISGESTGTAINSSGQIAGYTTIGFFFYNPHAFVYTNGVTQFLGSLGGGDSYPADISDAGQVVGYSNLASDINTVHAFLYSSGLMSDLGTLGGAGSSRATSINNLGQIVGNSNGAPFLYSGGIMTDLRTLLDPSAGWTSLSVAAISDTGYVAGTGTNAAGKQHAFLLTPVPSPSSAACLAIPLLTLAIMRRRTPPTSTAQSPSTPPTSPAPSIPHPAPATSPH